MTIIQCQTATGQRAARSLAAALIVTAASMLDPTAWAQTGDHAPVSQIRAAQTQLAAPGIDRKRQRRYCRAQLLALKRDPAGADGQSNKDFMKACLADVNPVADLPAAGEVMDAPVGSTGVCKDGTYASAVRKDAACKAHGGIARWFGG